MYNYYLKLRGLCESLQNATFEVLTARHEVSVLENVVVGLCVKVLIDLRTTKHW